MCEQNKIKTTILDFPLFVKAIKFVESVINNTKIKIEGNNIHICDMDDSRIMLFDLILKNIIEPPITQEKTVDLVSLTTKLNAIQIINGKVDVELTKDKIKFKQNSEHFSVNDSTDYDRDNIPLDNLRGIAYEFSKEINVEEFRDIVKKASVYSERIDILYDDQGVKFKTCNKNGEKYSKNYGYTTKEKKNRKTVCVMLLFLKLMTIPELFPNLITLKLKHNTPLLLKYSSSLIDFEGYLAPRVEEGPNV